MYCEKCGKEIPDGSDFCPECGFQIKNNVVVKTAGEKNMILAFIISFMLLMIAATFISEFGYDVYDYSSSSSGGHYHTVVPDRNTLAHTDTGAYYDHYEYGDDYLESQGYD